MNYNTNTTSGESGRAHAVCAIHGIPHNRVKMADRIAIRRIVAELANGECVYCGRTIDPEAPEGHPEAIELDRFVDACTYNVGNIVAACKPCNRRRSDRHPLTVATDTVRLYRAVIAMLAAGATIRDPKGYRAGQVQAATAMLADIVAAD